MRAALDTLKLLPGKRKIAVLGDMRELGPESEWWHRETGRYVVGRADRLICVGPLGRFLGEGAVEAGFPAAEIRSLDTPEQAANLLDSMLDAGDTVLFKASRGVGLERAVALLARLASVRPRVTPRSGAGADALLLALPARQVLSGLQRLPVHHVPHRDGGGDGASAAARARAADDPAAEAPADRPVDPRGRAAVAPGQGGHADDGRPADPASAIVVATLLWMDLSNRFVWIALGTLLALGAVGFADDFTKVARKRSLGLTGRGKLLPQFLVALRRGLGDRAVGGATARSRRS